MEKSIAVVGAGYWGKNLVRNFSQLGVLKTVCDAEPLTREQIAKDYPEVEVAGNFNSVLADADIQGVVIAAPAAQHFQLTRATLLAGKHAFVEKPLSLTYEEGEVLVRLSADCGRTLFVGHILNYHPAVIRLKEMINEGSIGRMQYIYARRLSLGKIRREENILWSFAPHDISIILGLVGEEPVYVDSVGSNFLHARIADVTMTNLKFPSGIGAHIFVSWLNPFKEQRLVIVGSEGMLVFDDTLPREEKLVLYPHTINWKDGAPVPVKADSQAIDLTSVWEEPLKAECRSFLAAIETGQPPITSGEEGLRVLRILEISQRSLEEKEKAADQIWLAPVPPSASSFFAHPSAVIDDGVSIGEGTKIWHFSHVMKGASIGEKCNIGQNVVVSPEVTIGNGVKIQNNVSVYEGVTLEDDVFCGPSMVFTNVYNPRSPIPRMKEVRSTLVRKGASLGANCTIVCGNTVGQYAFVGAGAVVKKDVPDYAMVAGNPARIKGWMCVCGNRIDFHGHEGKCRECGKAYRLEKDGEEGSLSAFPVE
ncbi:MAG: UDP-2-acetamido-3-amino-2,3-dideoxy-D-glucuronate N-acetyltransferase [Syntrophus sp. PtaB.Bin001]|nr:MAG: UDP-2-acetamido-3-amino-2,3-dideoxy-D-glucuronate N-acetyltransferase [Syntrophus sp. PtaB.Bin001]